MLELELMDWDTQDMHMRDCDGRVCSVHTTELHSRGVDRRLGTSNVRTLRNGGGGGELQEAWLGRCAILSVLGLFHSTLSSRVGDNWRRQSASLV